ncbi:Oxoglutarate/iron-dependent dioxygenase [Penicillium capsulatum]|uniref:Oxoglutarate/iron-dependent dioxygenase n=1 Tax=Penicillium capsulatum TaxID=69766 RepID=A0A9W9LRF2_9EURO|nr:Oxoglutarate/iron-dependent dioxygenase [Penicillium capsulatum]KAJ6135150.1 Oxoglutarate/iron-dependent dioxygenase [Penicillium capsulatum]
MAQIQGLDARDLPPDVVRSAYKKYGKISPAEIDHDPDILDLQRIDPDSLPEELAVSQYMSSQDLRLAFDDFIRGGHAFNKEHAPLAEDVPVFTHNAVSGLWMIPSLFPPTVQMELLSRLIHRDLSNPEYQTNLDLHYHVTYPQGWQADGGGKSFFADDPARLLQLKDPQTHSPLSIQKALEKKLRWVMLCRQQDETPGVDAPGTSSNFPSDIARLLQTPFPQAEAYAATLNLSSADETLSAHRDATAHQDVGLVSVNFGCDCLFLVSSDDGEGPKVIRLRSGDAVYMNGSARFAWHGVPRILPSTCPGWLADWPSVAGVEQGRDAQYSMWKGWMSTKQINLTVRQMARIS